MQGDCPIVAIVGAGLIGKSWSCVFARSGFVCRVYDSNPAQLKMAEVVINLFSNNIIVLSDRLFSIKFV
jgi:3-hydroxyacyl-CoA dehydrogenase